MASAVSRRPVIANGWVQTMVSPCEICGTLSGTVPVPVAARSKAYVCGHSPAGIVGSNPTGGMDVCCECCVIRYRSLRRADHSSRGVLATVVRRCV
jgi:hypothetical protein